MQMLFLSVASESQPPIEQVS